MVAMDTSLFTGAVSELLFFSDYVLFMSMTLVIDS